MLHSLGCEGYRAFAQATELELGRLTVVFGKNNSGKTTLARLPLFLAASLDAPAGYALARSHVRFGSSFRDLTSSNQPHPVLRLWATTISGARFERTLESVTQNLEERVAVTETQAPDMAGDIAAEVSALVHVSGVRPPIAPVYEARTPTDLSADEVPYWLRENAALADSVSEWFRHNFGIPIEIDETDYAFRIVSPGDVGFVNLAAAGRGTQALIPVVAVLKAVLTGMVTPSMVLIEEPEAHLHPSGHAAVAELIADASMVVPVLIETHSENLLLRLRRRIATRTYNSLDLSLVYVDESHRARRISVDATGAVRDWPSGVFEYDVEEARAIVEARIKSIEA